MIRIFIARLDVWDAALCRRVAAWTGKKFVDRLMALLSRMGDGPGYGVLGLAVLVFDPDAAVRLIPAMLTGFGLELVLQKGLKHALRRPRPCRALPEIRNLITLPDEFSFPSGHTAGAFLTATLCTAFVPQAAVPAFTLAFLIGLSRVYNGVHYPGDVLAGFLLGVFSARISLMFFL